MFGNEGRGEGKFAFFGGYGKGENFFLGEQTHHLRPAPAGRRIGGDGGGFGVLGRGG